MRCVKFFLVISMVAWEGSFLMVDNSYMTFVWEVNNWYWCSIIGTAIPGDVSFSALNSIKTT